VLLLESVAGFFDFAVIFPSYIINLDDVFCNFCATVHYEAYDFTAK
jgi:hypothetical protein